MRNLPSAYLKLSRFFCILLCGTVVLPLVLTPQVSQSSPLCLKLFEFGSHSESQKVTASANTEQLRNINKMFAEDSQQMAGKNLTALKITLSVDETSVAIESVIDFTSSNVILVTTKHGLGWEISANPTFFDIQFRGMQRLTVTGIPLIQIYYSIIGDPLSQLMPRQFFLVESPSLQW